MIPTYMSIHLWGCPKSNERYTALNMGEKRKKWILCFEFAKIGVEITII